VVIPHKLLSSLNSNAGQYHLRNPKRFSTNSEYVKTGLKLPSQTQRVFSQIMIFGHFQDIIQKHLIHIPNNSKIKQFKNFQELILPIMCEMTKLIHEVAKLLGLTRVAIDSSQTMEKMADKR